MTKSTDHTSTQALGLEQQPSFGRTRHIHMVGIGGIGMSGMAENTTGGFSLVLLAQRKKPSSIREGMATGSLV